VVCQIGIAVPLDKPKTYRSYLIRCWVFAQGDDARGRFVVESIAGEPQRWGFETFDDLVAFLRVRLLEQEPEQRDDPSHAQG
jgi:hypothetical protein